MTAGQGTRYRTTTASPGGTARFGALLAAVLQPGDILLLSGELGAGKTTLVKGIVAALGSDEVVTSPTFTLCRTYDTVPAVAHVDCWRLGQLHDLADLALEEMLDEGSVALVEWGELAAPLYGSEALAVTLSVPDRAGDGPSGERVVDLVAPGPRWDERIVRMLEAWAEDGGE